MLYNILQTSNVKKSENIVSLGPRDSLKKYLTKFVKLNKIVDDIASLPREKEPLQLNPKRVIKTKNIIHNRINKAGSTSIMGMSR